MPSLELLKNSREYLREITLAAYNDEIRPIALAHWEKHLTKNNPQWKYITAEQFYIKDNSGTAHVLAMYDERLPAIGIVGYFACTSPEAGAKVLGSASLWLKSTYGTADIYGPINGTLPSDYRINLNDDFIFPGEPVNPSWHIDAFQQAGFDVFNRYVSGISKRYLFFMRAAIQKPKKGFTHMTVRPFDEKRYAHDFKIYHELRNQIFPFQSHYCPAISLKERIYHAGEKFDTNYTYFLMDNDREVGFIMAYSYKKMLILKTIGILPEYRNQRLKGLLIKPIRQRAKQEGLKACIYAMVREGNNIHKTRGPGVNIFRNYVTMHKRL